MEMAEMEMGKMEMAEMEMAEMEMADMAIWGLPFLSVCSPSQTMLGVHGDGRDGDDQDKDGRD